MGSYVYAPGIEKESVKIKNAVEVLFCGIKVLPPIISDWGCIVRYTLKERGNEIAITRSYRHVDRKLTYDFSLRSASLSINELRELVKCGNKGSLIESLPIPEFNSRITLISEFNDVFDNILSLCPIDDDKGG